MTTEPTSLVDLLTTLVFQAETAQSTRNAELAAIVEAARSAGGHTRESNSEITAARGRFMDRLEAIRAEARGLRAKAATLYAASANLTAAMRDAVEANVLALEDRWMAVDKRSLLLLLRLVD